MILGLIEHDRGRLNKVSLEILETGRKLAEHHNTKFLPAIIGEIAPAMAAELGASGISEAYHISHPRLDDFAPEAWAEGLGQLARSTSAHAMIAVGTDRGNEVIARLAARLGLPFAANCIEIQPGNPYTVARIRWGGSLFEEARLHGDPWLLTLAAHAFPAEETPQPVELRTRIFKPQLDDANFQVRVMGRIEPERAVSLADARVVVGGGRGIGSAEGFAVLEELAALIGGVVGGSRVATNLGWRPHADQIGQTGTRIAPDLYIACGISGAIQHWVGCMGSKKVLAINIDPEAPIIAKSDYAVIGDLHEIIPALCEELREKE